MAKMLTVLISIISNSQVFLLKLEMCPQYTDAPAVGYLIIKPQTSTWCKCLNLSLTGSSMYVRTENLKTICPQHHPMRGHKNVSS